MSSDSEDELSCMDTPSIVQPYMFEPTAANFEMNCESSEESEVEEGNVPLEIDATPVQEWCKCGQCDNMSTQLECRCCHTYPAVLARFGEETKCITEVTGFQSNCLDLDVLETTAVEYNKFEGPVGDDEPIHELYRYLAYRRFVRWIWRILGKHNRKVLPSCVVLRIRQQFPSANYAGFKYPDL